MLPIEIYYREPLTLRIWKRKFTGELPSSWNEASEKFWVAFSRWLLDTPKEKKKAAIYFFMHDCLPFPSRILKSLNKAIANDIVSALPFLTEKIITHKVAIPEIKISASESWFFHDEYFHSMTVEQFLFCERIQRQYMKTQSLLLLNELVAALYSPKDSTDFMQALYPKAIKEKTKIVERTVDDAVKKAVYLNFIAMMNYLQEHPKLKVLFPKQDDTNSLSSMLQPSKPADWGKTIHQMSGAQLGTVNEVEKHPTFYFLNRLAERVKEAKQNKNRK